MLFALFKKKNALLATKYPKAPEVQDGSLMQNYVWWSVVRNGAVLLTEMAAKRTKELLRKINRVV